MATDVFTLKNPAGTTVFSVDSDGTVTALAGFVYSGTDDFGSSGIKADVIAESTAATGVTIDGALIKDAHILDSVGFYDAAAPTKIVRLDAGAVTAGQTRVLAMPDANVTITAAAATVLDDTTVGAMATTLGLGTGDSPTWTGGTFSGAVNLNDGSLLQRKGAGTGTGDVIEVLGPDSTHGMKTSVYEATVSPAAIETALFTVPAMSVIDSVQANVETALTGGGTTATFSIGITGDVDLYGTATNAGAQADLLTKNAKCDAFGGRGSGAGAGLGVFTAATQSLKLIGAATGGATAGDTALTAGSVKIRVVYRTLMSLVDAA